MARLRRFNTTEPAMNQSDIKMRFVKAAFLILVFMLCFTNSLGAEQAMAGAANDAGQKHEGLLAIKFYQKYISGIDGDRCSMYPSCSHYSAQAIRKHGWFKGWIMTSDRLIRCGRDESKFSAPVMVNGRQHTYDPIDRNDLWKTNTTWNPHPQSVT